MANCGFPVDNDCIFCKIIAGELPSARIYESDTIFAFLDINPVAKGHTLIVPKGHYPTLLETPLSLAEPLLQAMRLVAAGLRDVLQCDGFNCLQNNLSAAGQMVFHTHWHIIPRFNNDGLCSWKHIHYRDTDEMQKTAASVNTQIAGRLSRGVEYE